MGKSNEPPAPPSVHKIEVSPVIVAERQNGTLPIHIVVGGVLIIATGTESTVSIIASLIEPHGLPATVSVTVKVKVIAPVNTQGG